eukprot:UN04858
MKASSFVRTVKIQFYHITRKKYFICVINFVHINLNSTAKNIILASILYS